jgi:cyclic pyranopterin phosphate synthase
MNGPKSNGAAGLVDSFGRRFTYLRVSVTDLCNLRCVYCMPDEGVKWLAHSEILTFEEIARIVEAAASAGVCKVRLTGGEPLVRHDIAVLTGMIAKVPGITDLALTTNGTRLAKLAEPLARAGLRRINISLDTLDPEKFKTIARRHQLKEVLDGITAAGRAGLRPLKINMVVLGGLNDQEAADFAALTLEQDLEARFIEYMPLEESRECALGSGKFEFVSNTLTRERIEARFGALEVLESGEKMKGPAEVCRIKGAAGRLGFISAMSAPFCKNCDRLRLTASGELRSCLLDGGGISLMPILRGGGSREDIIAAFQRTANLKPETHKDWHAIPADSMSRIGG